MYLYLISQSERCGYDTYDSAVVCAGSANEARNTHPGYSDEWDSYTWASSPDNVEAVYLGIADPSLKLGVVCVSFNAG